MSIQGRDLLTYKQVFGAIFAVLDKLAGDTQPEKGQKRLRLSASALRYA